ncbi:MAG TPA: hypothetical protein VLJ17_06300 [Xanthobacteraceae bacterium]|nr:hypothetical protein [Xanthobacteraceae bacterium]
MTIAVVNGFLCFSSCEAATAAKGQNPHHYPATADHGSVDVPGRDGAAVIFGGALKVSGNGGTIRLGTNSSNEPASTSTDILV